MGDNKGTVLQGKIEARFGWDAYPRQYSGGFFVGLISQNTAIDCDASAVFLNTEGLVLSGQADEACLSWKNSSMFGGAVRHMGDNRIGDKADDEIITIDLDLIPDSVGTIVFTLDLFKEKHRIGAGQLQNSFVRIVEAKTGEESCRCGFSSLGGGIRLIVCGLLRREKKGWVFEKLGRSFPAGSMEDFLGQVSSAALQADL